jgi:hypothetical protein
MKLKADDMAINPKRVITGTCIECGQQVSGFSAQRMVIEEGEVGLEVGIYVTDDFKQPGPGVGAEFHVYDRVRFSDIPQPKIPGGVA